jgi:transposase
MNKQSCRNFNPAHNAKVAHEAVKNPKTLAELAKEFDINPVVISKMNTYFLRNLTGTSEKLKDNDSKEFDAKELYATIGQLKVENEFLIKSCKKLGIAI